MEYFSIVIPTMWRCNLIHRMLPVYQECDLVKEVIIINNDVQATPPFDKWHEKYDKILMFDQIRNIYVNPAWNLGASVAKHTVILANDDIIIDNLYRLLTEIQKAPYELIGASVNNLPVRGESRQRAEAIFPAGDLFPRASFGCFMVVRKYHPIPDALKIWAGDDFLFTKASTKGMINSRYIATPVNQTMNTDVEFLKIGADDHRLYVEMKDNNLI